MQRKFLSESGKKRFEKAVSFQASAVSFQASAVSFQVRRHKLLENARSATSRFLRLAHRFIAQKLLADVVRCPLGGA